MNIKKSTGHYLQTLKIFEITPTNIKELHVTSKLSKNPRLPQRILKKCTLFPDCEKFRDYIHAFHQHQMSSVQATKFYDSPRQK